ncbi:MAG: mechanosensitive ion channel family protein [Nitrospirae bacterium]|nr:MAG: mechanosensitive ion channel family protein [Nitrospirota bacterium]
MSLNNIPVDLLIKYGLQVLGAIVILGVGLFLARSVGNMTEKWLQRQDMEPPVRLLLVRVAKLLVIGLTLIVALDTFGVQVGPLIAGIGVAGVGIGLALQGVLGNAMAGLSIIFTKPYRVGEYIEIAGVYGQVESIDIFSTKLLHADRSRVVIPNRKIVGEILHNYGTVRQLHLSVGVGYGTNLTDALAIVHDVLGKNPRVLKDPEPAVGISQLADSAITISINPWTKVPDFGAAQAELYQALVERLRARNIDIPFPQREVRLLNAQSPAQA